jgi:hypothetical protein
VKSCPAAPRRFDVDAARHEVAPGQHEIDFRYEHVLLKHVSPREVERYPGVY